MWMYRWLMLFFEIGDYVKYYDCDDHRFEIFLLLSDEKIVWIYDYHIEGTGHFWVACVKYRNICRKKCIGDVHKISLICLWSNSKLFFIMFFSLVFCIEIFPWKQRVWKVWFFWLGIGCLLVIMFGRKSMVHSSTVSTM